MIHLTPAERRQLPYKKLKKLIKQNRLVKWTKKTKKLIKSWYKPNKKHGRAKR